MRPVRLFDKALFLVLASVWAAGFALSVRSAVQNVSFMPVLVSGSASSSNYPSVSGFAAGMTAERAGLRLGDRLLRLGDVDLRGVGNLEFWALAAEHTDPESLITVEFERDSERGRISLRPASYAINWPLLLASFVFAATALVLFVRATPSPLVTACVQAHLCFAIALAGKFGASLSEIHAAMAITGVSIGLAGPLALRALLSFPDGGPPTGPNARRWPWLFSAFGILTWAVALDWISYQLFFAGLAALTAAFGATFVVVATRRYRYLDPIARRQGKWVLWGVYCAAVVRLAAITWLAVAPSELAFRVYSVSFIALALVPLSLLVAIVRFNFFDVDRLLSATASYNAVLVVLLATGLVVVPRAALAASEFAGISSSAAQVALSLMLAAIVVPAHRRLRPWIDRTFFKERYAADHGVGQLLAVISSCRDARDLLLRAGEGLHRLFRPEPTVVYAFVEACYMPVLVAGRAVPPAFAAACSLVQTLAARSAPLVLCDVGRRSEDAPLDGFDRAALATLEAELILPVHQEAALAAFLCLGPKRSGDVYTPADLSLLTAVATTLSLSMLRFDQEETLRQAREMQVSLRRYVPGAVAEQLERGAELAPSQREVSVLFVDLRGYTSFAEPRRAEEIFSTVNRYTETVSQIVRRHGGSVVEFNGDGMMAVFGAPQELPHKQRAAVAAGREIIGAVGALPVDPAQGGEEKLSVGVGIATGEAFVGSIRAADRMIWSAIGNTTNLAARLQSLSRELDAALVIDAATWQALAEARRGFVRHGAVPIRGRRQTADLYCLPLTR